MAENKNEDESSIATIFQDNSGGLSSIRILMILWGVGVFLVWAATTIMSLIHGVYVIPSLPSEVITILLGVTGIKSVQRFGEK